MYRGDSQFVYVQVQTPEGHRPVTGVKIELAISYNGRTELMELDETDGAGYTQGNLALVNVAPGQNVKTELMELDETDGAGYTQGNLALVNVAPGQNVKVLVTASAPGGPTIGTTSQLFRVWW